MTTIEKYFDVSIEKDTLLSFNIYINDFILLMNFQVNLSHG